MVHVWGRDWVIRDSRVLRQFRPRISAWVRLASRPFCLSSASVASNRLDLLSVRPVVHGIIRTMNAALSAPSQFPVGSTSFLLDGPTGALEVATAMPADSALAGTAVICHPHSLQGGTMTNKVVTTLERALRELGLATVRFNFRGVGQSGGVFDDGVGETEDLAAVVAWVRRVHPHDALWLAGFSFGSFVALRAARRLGAAQLIQVAPPVGRWQFATIELPDCPWLVVQGDADEVVDANAVYAWIGSLPRPPQLVKLADTSHFFHGKLMDLRSVVQEGVRAHLPPLRA
jgi:alpha/beta superfamily hydrolase